LIHAWSFADKNKMFNVEDDSKRLCLSSVSWLGTRLQAYSSLKELQRYSRKEKTPSNVI